MLLSRALPLVAAPQGLSRRAAGQRGAVSRPQRALRCSAAGGEEGEAGPSGRDLAAELPPLKQVPYRAIAALAAVGLADTAYLTAVKLMHLTPACPLSGGCADVLTSDYANLFGVVPLSVVGLLAYGGMAALAWQGWRHSPQGQAVAEPAPAAAAAAAVGTEPVPAGRQAQQEQEESPFRTAVLAGGLAMASCSAFLLYILFTKFSGELCPWCLASAALSFGIAGLAVSGLRQRELADAAGPGAGVVATTLLLLSVGLGNPNGSFAYVNSYDLDYELPVVTTQSSPAAVSLAQRLSDAGAKMYGAFWCSHCYEQKQTFGAEAMAAFPYVECYPEGLYEGTRMAEVCQKAPGGLQGFPTWVIGGEQLVGEQTFEQLEAALAKAEAKSAAAAQAQAYAEAVVKALSGSS